MARDRTPAPEDTVDVAADHELVQRLLDARQLGVANDEESGWRELAGRIERILAAAGVDPVDGLREPVADPSDAQPEADVLAEPDTVDRAAASLAALLDRPDEDQLELANRAIRDLEAALR
jgi:hypothetical protein